MPNHEIHRKFETLMNAGDLDGLAALYLPNAVLSPSPGNIAKGSAEIHAALAPFLASKPTIRMETVGVFETGDGLALVHAKWKLTGTEPGGKPFEMSGTSAEVIQKQADGSWRYIIDNPFAA